MNLNKVIHFLGGISVTGYFTGCSLIFAVTEILWIGSAGKVSRNRLPYKISFEKFHHHGQLFSRFQFAGYYLLYDFLLLKQYGHSGIQPLMMRQLTK
jgi:hypothetical protein